VNSLNDTIESASVFILDASLRSTFVLLVTILIGWSLRSAAASSRRLVWIGGLTTSLMVPLMMAVGPSVPVAILSREAPQQDIATIDRIESVDPPAVPSRQADLAVTEVAAIGDAGGNFQDTVDNEIAQPLLAGPSELTLAARDRRTQQAGSSRTLIPAWLTLTVAALLLGIVAQLVRLVVGNFRVHGLVRKSTDDTPQEWATDWHDAKAAMQVGDTVSLKESSADISPLACGVLRQTVLFPTAARGWEHDRRQAVMLHELGHVRQRDVAAILLGQLAAAVFFFHPLVWFVVRQLRHDCERACDDLVLNAGQKPIEYARHLAEIARSFSASHHQNVLAMAMSRSSNIESRVTAILDSDTPRKPLSSVTRRLVLAGALLLGAIVAAPRAGHSQTEIEVTPAPARTTATDDGSKRSPEITTYQRVFSPKPLRQRTDAGNVFTALSAPDAWNIDSGENVQWSAKLGSQTLGSPVVSGGRVFIGTNNAGEYLEAFPEARDLGCLLAFDVQTGNFLWQYSAEKLATGRVNDWPRRGITASPYVEDDRLWIVTNRSEVVCIDTEGFHDGEDDGLLDGPHSESLKAGDSQPRKRADVVWTVDLMKTFGSFPHNHSDCTITSDGKLLFIVVPNGTDHTHRDLPSPKAPSFVALDAKTGAVVWTNRDSENQILHGQWSSAVYGQLGGVSQVICPSGSGWLFGLDATTGETLWKFDCNPKDSKWILGSKGRWNNLIAKPLIYDGRVYMATGQDPEHGEGNADLWCIDPTKRGDVSPQIVNRSQFVPNSDSAVVWHFDQEEFTPNGEPVFEYFFHRSISTPVAKDGLLIAADTAGLVHCFDAKTGQRHWTHDLFAACLSSPIIINDRVYVGGEDGDVAILALLKQKKLIAEINMKEVITTTPTVDDGVLYVATRSRLFAIKPRATVDDAAIAAKAKVKELTLRQEQMALQTLSRQIDRLSAALAFTNKQEVELAADRMKLQQQTMALELRLKAFKKLVDEVSKN
jgi:beta-lactamase regulating signal transducer with metallopeptidase domain/outer membrane protein assembly factor BamB